ncbi:MAG: colanic acid biosynthesis glycosyltransferase WcaL, partial [Lautropia mirabilis]
MSEPRSPIAVGYVLKRYPRFSETFVVNEILALEKAGVQVDIFALGPVSETHFQEAISRVRAPVHRIRHQFHDTELYWQLLVQARKALPEFRRLAHLADDHDWVTVGQAVLLAMQAQSKGIRHLHAHFGTQAATVARLAAAFAGIHYSFTAHAKDIYHQYEEPVQLDLKIRDAAFTVTVSD